MAKNRVVTITDSSSGKSLDCEVQTGTYGRDVVDIKALSAELGFFTHARGGEI